MAKFDIDGGIGDIGEVVRAARGVADLSWLVVDEEEYRKQEALPMQNLDIVPELQKALAMTDGDDIPHAIPATPYVMVNRNPLDTPDRPKTDLSIPIRNRVARMIMEGAPPRIIHDRILLEFSPTDVRLAADAIREVVSERGLLGNVFVDASHFPDAARSSKERKAAKSLGKGAMFVIGGCGGCDGCNCHETGVCSTFGGKRVVDEVPYSAKLAAHYAPRLVSENRPIDLPSSRIASSDWKERIRAAFLKTPVFRNPDGVLTARTQQVPVRTVATDAQVADFLERKSSETPSKVLSAQYAKYARRMMDGKDDRDALVASPDPEIRSLASEFGLLGHTWVDADALGGCRKTLDFVRSKFGSYAPDFVVRRSASQCPLCLGASDGACAELCRVSSVVSTPPTYDKRVFAKALVRAVASGRVQNDAARSAVGKARQASDWRSLTRQANLYSMPAGAVANYAGAAVSAFTGSGATSDPTIDADTIRVAVSRMMNAGLSGAPLRRAILNKFTRSDLSRFPELGARLASGDGVQGHYYVDPTAYSDYGRGCDSGAKEFRKRGAPNVLASGGCTGCSLQTAPGWCSKYSKTLVRTVPDEIRAAVASARRVLPVVTPDFEDPVEKYGLATQLEVGERSQARVRPDITVSSPEIG